VLLAFDTATPEVCAAVYDADTDEVLVELVAERPMKHGEQLAPLIERCLTTAGLDRRDLTAIAVGVGPGPFTGLRVGLVTARTLAHVLDLPTYGVCTLDVLAVEAVESGLVAEPFLVATDARRKEVYLASYDAAGVRREGPVVTKPAEVATALPVVGPGATLYPEAFPTARGPQRPSAAWLARAVAGERVELLDPDPLYLRRPDAVAAAPRVPATPGS